MSIYRVLFFLATAQASLDIMPLIPHHVQKARRLKELREKHGGLQVDEEMFENQFRRREEALQVGALYHGYGTHYADGKLVVKHGEGYQARRHL